MFVALENLRPIAKVQVASESDSDFGEQSHSNIMYTPSVIAWDMVALTGLKFM